MGDLKQSMIDYLSRDTVKVESVVSIGEPPVPIEDMSDIEEAIHTSGTFTFKITTVDEEIVEANRESFLEFWGRERQL